MPIFIDTHSHLYLPEFDSDRDGNCEEGSEQRRAKNSAAQYRQYFH